MFSSTHQTAAPHLYRRQYPVLRRRPAAYRTHSLDGVEVLNLNPRHDSRNDRAEEYAALHGLLRTGGSDCHRSEDIAAGGILAEELPEDTAGFVRRRQYPVLRRRPAAYRTHSGTPPPYPPERWYQR